MQNLPNRKSIRLKNYNYAENGLYFITICSYKNQKIFGNINQISNEKIILSKVGKIIQKHWFEIPEHYKFAELDFFVIMPDHIHGIILLDNGRIFAPDGINKFQNVISNSISSIIRSFKASVTKAVRQELNIQFVWQRGFYEHVIKNEKELNKIREYIYNNPLKFKLEKTGLKIFNPYRK